ncbi:DUF308 domain-containing protein [Nocardia sp. SSK8]|uniref:DUF308 domain-containing protein n=1 Tax=Nocardia sp. SSK8 TaxID=3120154 RepID=UPI003009B9F8
MSGRDGTRRAMLVAGSCSFLLGLVLLLWPGRSTATLALVFGTALLVSAGMQVYLAFSARMAIWLRGLVVVSATLTGILAMLAFSGGTIELLALWIGIGWAVRGTVQALVAAWDDGLAGGALHEVCGVVTAVIGIVVIAMKFETVTGLATLAGAALLIIGVLELLTGGLLRSALRGPVTGP